MGREKNIMTSTPSTATNRDLLAAFRKEHALPSTVMILDGTGPCVSMHFPNLSLLSFSDLQTLKSVYAFSGGIFAFVSIFARENGFLRHDPEEYVANLDKKFRSFHHKGLSQLPLVFWRYLRKGSLYGADPLLRHVEYVFKPDFLAADVSALPKNFKPYLCDRQKDCAKEIDVVKGGMTIRELLAASVMIPFLYGDAAMPEWSDVIYSKDFKSVYFGITRDPGPKIVSTMWKGGRKDDRVFLCTLRGGSPRRRLFGDIAKLVLNIPNSNFRHDMERGFVQAAGNSGTSP